MTRQIRLPFKVKGTMLACGADLKGAFAIAKGGEALLVNGFGDLGDLDNFTKYEKAVRSQLKKMKASPGIAACDLHPGYFSTRFAEDFASGLKHTRLCRVQHHQAHVASAILENGIEGNVIGVAFDGTGFGSDGNIWGGEFFVGTMKRLVRAAHFEYVAMPGGDKAILQPWRMAVSYLYKIKSGSQRFKKQEFIKNMIDNGINSPLTSSVGRLFDAVGCLVLRKDAVRKEAELPMELEKIALSCDGQYGFSIRKDESGLKVDVSGIVKGVLKDLSMKTKKGIISGKFHNTLAEVILNASLRLSKRFLTKKVVLSGGVFQNRLLSDKAADLLNEKGFAVYRHRNIPTSDFGIPIGQIAIANARLGCA